MELFRIVLLCIAFIGIALLVKIILIAHKDRQQQIKEVIQKIRRNRRNKKLAKSNMSSEDREKNWKKDWE